MTRPSSATPELPTRNPNVRMRSLEVLSDHWYVLRKAVFDYRAAGGAWSRQEREAYDRGNGATILLFDQQRRTVVLTRQFRAPAYLNGHPDGVLIEAPAGLLDEHAGGPEDAEAAIRREVAEETGYCVGAVTRLFELFMSPGSVTERVAFYVADYSPADRAGAGGGVADEGEDIEVLELPLDDAWAMVQRGDIVDGKTVVLLQWALARSAPTAPALC